MAQQLRAVATLAEKPGLIPCTPIAPTTFCNSSSKGFWLPWAVYILMHKHTCRPNTHMQKIQKHIFKNKIKFQKRKGASNSPSSTSSGHKVKYHRSRRASTGDRFDTSLLLPPLRAHSFLLFPQKPSVYSCPISHVTAPESPPENS